jgi:uncharacterized protein YndB with AHSA1/START domain
MSAVERFKRLTPAGVGQSMLLCAHRRNDMSGADHGVLVVRRSIHIMAPPERVWQQFASFDRLNRWWGIIIGEPEAGRANGQRLLAYEPKKGGRIEMEVTFKGAGLRYGGVIVVFDPGRELTFESDWIPNQGWLRPTLITLSLVPALGGTLVELTHHNFEATGVRASDDHAAYEAGWGMTQLNALREVVNAAAA